MINKLTKKIIIGLISIVLLGCSLHPVAVTAATSGKDLTWTKVTKESESSNLYDIAYNKDNVYITVGDDGAVIRSTNGRNWSNIRLQTVDNLKAITTNGKDFVAVGSNGAIIKSKDGITWTKGSISFSKELTYEKITGKMRSYIEKDYKVNWGALPKQSQIDLRDVLWDGKQYVVIGHWEVQTGNLKQGSYSTNAQVRLYSNFIITSKDGGTWEAKYIDIPDIEKIIYTGAKYVTTSGEKIAFSQDLKKWKVTAPDVRGDISDIIFENGKYMIIGWDGSLNSIAGTIHTSTNGIDWKEVINKENIGSLTHTIDDTYKKYGKANGFSNLSMKSVLWDGSQYVIAGYKGMVLTSKSGTNWKKLNQLWDVTVVPLGYSDSTAAKANIQKIIFDGKQYIQVGNNGTILVSENLEKGIVARARPSVDYDNIVYDGKNRYIASGNEGGLWESSNGYNWSKVSLGSGDEELSWEGVAAYNGTIIAVCREKTGLVGYGDCFYYYSDKPGSWSKMSFPDNFMYTYGAKYLQGKFHLFTRNGLITSKDGKNWSGYTLKNNMLKDIIYNGKIYVGRKAINDGDISADTLYTSTDYKKWSRVWVEKDGKKYYLSAANVVWNGKQFVTIGGKLHKNSIFSDETVVALSSDGIKWEIKETEDDFEYGIYGNKTYIAFDYFGDIYTSTNGIHYNKSTKVTSQSLRTALWDGKKFLVAGEMGVILSSTKDKNAVLPKQDKWQGDNYPYSIVY